MKFFESKKDNSNKRVVRLMGIKLYEQITTYDGLIVKIQKILYGLITTIKKDDENNYHSEKDVKLFGLTFLKRIEDEDNGSYYLFGKKIKSYSISENFYKKYKKHFNKKYDDIYILNANSGEACLFLVYLFDAFLKKNESKCPLIIATKEYHLDLLKLICPEIPFVYIKKLHLKIKMDSFKIDKFRFFILFTHNHFLQTEIDIKNKPLGEAHYFTSILNRLQMNKNDVVQRKIEVPKDIIDSTLNKVENIGLNLDKFIFIAPEAQSCILIKPDFWVKTINDYRKQGYDVFVNLTQPMPELSAVEYKTLPLTFLQAYVIAGYAKKIIALRSGICDLLSFTNVPMDVLYTPFKYRLFLNEMSLEQVKSGFNLIQLKLNNSKITEISFDGEIGA